MNVTVTKKPVSEILEEFPNAKRDKLIPILQKVQESHKFLSKEAVVEIGEYLNLPISKIYGVATFYNQFRFTPIGKYEVLICRGTACHVAGSSTVLEILLSELKIKAGETTKDGLFTVDIVACIGACGLAPVISINGEFHAHVTPESIRKTIADYRKRETANVQ